MEYLWIVIVAAATFALCFGLDKGFSRLFRNRSQHKSGLQVRLNKRYASIGLIVGVLGIAVLIAAPFSTLLVVCGIIMVLVGIGLVTYYMTFGVFYDEDGFLLTTFGKKSRLYTYKEIRGQMLYNVQGTSLVELHMEDGTAVQLQSTMTGTYTFLDKAFDRWCSQKGIDPQDCEFHKPEESRWFPPVEVA